MKILITGGCGYVGSELIKYLLLKGHTITNIDTRWFGNTLKKHKKTLKNDVLLCLLVHGVHYVKL